MEIEVKVFRSPSDAPSYLNTHYVTIMGVNVVRKGTEKGNPTIDFVMQDNMGNVFTTMLTGSLMRALHSVLESVDPDGGEREIEVRTRMLDG